MKRGVNETSFCLILNYCKIEKPSEWVPIFQKYVSWVKLALFLCHQMAHVLEFRIVRKKSLQTSGAAFATPPFMTCREAGVAWEVKTLGGTIMPVCATDYDFSSQIGLALRSAAWNFNYMAIPNKWIRAVFSEEHWNTDPDPLHIPFKPVLALEPQVDNTTGGDDGESSRVSKCQACLQHQRKAAENGQILSCACRRAGLGKV